MASGDTSFKSIFNVAAPALLLNGDLKILIFPCILYMRLFKYVSTQATPHMHSCRAYGRNDPDGPVGPPWRKRLPGCIRRCGDHSQCKLLVIQLPGGWHLSKGSCHGAWLYQSCPRMKTGV